MDTQTKDPILKRLEADLARVQNTLEVARRWLESGKTLAVQCKKDQGDTWGDIKFPNFLMPDGEYRIRPEPRRIWVTDYPNGLFGVYESEKAASAQAGPDLARVVEFVEVIK